MRMTKRRKLEKSGRRLGRAGDFLNLTEAERNDIEIKQTLAHVHRHFVTQKRLAVQLILVLATICCRCDNPIQAAILQTGSGREFSTIQSAVNAALPGDIIKVWPLSAGKAYRCVAILVRKPRLTIEAAQPGQYVKINGNRLNYSGRGRIARAIFQFNPSASGCILRGFELTGAHNRSCNGAGVRINAANHVTIQNCYIHNNDMGIMSNGSLARGTGADQIIERCRITRNGSWLQAGYNHNLYLGGTSVLVRGCDISHSLTGHDLKSRAHITDVEYCYIHDSANRELDLVDKRGNTDAPQSNALVLGCLIVKKNAITGNHEVINFGRDGKANHSGTLYLVHDTIRTPYPTAVVTLSAAGARLVLLDNNFVTSQHRATLIIARNGGRMDNIRGTGNIFATAYQPVARRFEGPMLHWRKIVLPWAALGLKPARLMRYNRSGQVVPWPHSTAGAGTSQ